MPKQSEKITERYLNKQVDLIGGQSYKWVSPGKKGVPDRICLFPKDIFRLVELKTEDAPLEPIQDFVHAELSQVTTKVCVIDTMQDIDYLINGVKREMCKLTQDSQCLQCPLAKDKLDYKPRIEKNYYKRIICGRKSQGIRSQETGDAFKLFTEEEN